jgi:cell division protease FtsH
VLGVRQKDYSDETATKIDLAVKQLIDEAYASAKKILTSRRKDLDAGTKLLLEKETITPDDFPPLKQKEKAAA